MTETRDITGLKNKYYVGDYQGCQCDIESLGQGVSAEAELFLLRCNIAQGKYKYVKNSIETSSVSPDKLALRLLATYYDTEEKRPVLQTLEQMAQETKFSSCVTFRIVQATILAHEDRLEDAYYCLQQIPDSLETLSLRVNLALMMNRLPVATQDHAKMRQINSEGALSRLAAALIALQQGQQEEAMSIYQDLKEKYGSTSFLLNAQANVLLQKTPNPDFAGAQVLLRDALRLNPNNFDVVATLLICLEHMMNPDDATQIDYLRKQLRTEAPWHPYVTKMARAEAALNSVLSH